MKFKKHKAVFLDRDGTICEEVGYLDSVEQMRLLPRAAEAVRLLNRHGFKAVVVTNQSGVARGFFPESRLEELHAEMTRQLRELGAQIDAIYYCPHHPTEGYPPYLQECNCRKPSIGLLQRAAEDLDLDLSSSYMIGDHFSDVECGQRVGAQTILLLTGHGQETLAKSETWSKLPSYIAQDLYEAVQWIMEHSEKS
jgi:D-glycero-D-manno-heptose 1,7-bisphosphate phosphatase